MKGAILNVNGIIIDNDRQEFAAWQQLAMYEYGMGLPGKLAPEFKGLSREEALQKVAARFHEDLDADRAKELLAGQDRFYQQELAKLEEGDLIPGIERLVVAFYDHYSKVAVNDIDGHAAEILKQTKLDSFVDLVAPAKDNPYAELPKQLDIPAAGCIAIGTTADQFSQMKDAGATAIAVGSVDQLQTADYQVTVVGDLRYQMLEKVWEDQNE